MPFSTHGRKASCWARLNRWISSQKRIVPRPSYLRRSSAALMISRTRATPSVTAENGSKWRGGELGNKVGGGGLPPTPRPPPKPQGPSPPHVNTPPALPPPPHRSLPSDNTD